MRPRRRRRGFANERPIRRFAHRVNNQIDAKDVRLISETGEQLGVRRVADALAYARERDLDLVEVAPTADPPVCRVTDYS